jgi:carbonic anhydrase/acetyltransferase-like protein (isoleucine patch superfamily)
MAIGARTNIQDGAMLHSDAGVPLTIGADCTVGHHAILHGCTVGDATLIGMGATILNAARIGRACIVGANALVTEGKEFPDFSLIVGAPAKVVRTLDPETEARLRQGAAGYVANWQRFAAGLVQVG